MNRINGSKTVAVPHSPTLFPAKEYGAVLGAVVADIVENDGIDINSIAFSASAAMLGQFGGQAGSVFGNDAKAIMAGISAAFARMGIELTADQLKEIQNGIDENLKEEVNVN